MKAKPKFKIKLWITLLILIIVPLASICMSQTVTAKQSAHRMSSTLLKALMDSNINNVGVNIDYYISEKGVDYAFQEDILAEEARLASNEVLGDAVIYFTDLSGNVIWSKGTVPEQEKGILNDIDTSVDGKISIKEYKIQKSNHIASIYVSNSGNFAAIISLSEDEALSDINNLPKAMTRAAIFAIIFWGVIGFVVVKVVTKPIINAIKRAEQIADGDLSEQPANKVIISETSELLDTIDRLRNKLSSTVSNINDGMASLASITSEVSSSVKEANEVANSISSSIDEVASGNMETAEGVQDIVEKMGNIGNAIDAVSEYASASAKDAEAVKSIADSAVKTLETLVSANSATVTSSEEVVETVRKTTDAIDKVHKLVSIITDIADQTNLLSLNASIEAARAGEAGRGFAVVAAEVSKLAAECNESAIEISDSMNEIIALSQKCNESADKILASVGSEASALKEVQSQFVQVKDSVDSTAKSIAGITEKTGVVIDEKAHILDNISTLSAISEESAALTASTADSTTELTRSFNAVNAIVENVDTVVGSLGEAVSELKKK